MTQRPKRISSQKWNEVTCILCTFNNLHQQEIFTDQNQLINNYRYLCQENGLRQENDVSDKNGIVQDVLFNYFKTHDCKVKEVSKTKKNIPWGWAIFEVKNKGYTFYHAVAIVHNFLIDSIRIESNTGVYPWNGHLIGFDFEKLQNVYQIIV